MVSLATVGSSCTLVMWFIAKFCMFFGGGMVKQKHNFSCFFNPRMVLVFVCHPFHLVLCSLFRLPGRLIAPFAINSRCLQSVPGSRFFNHFLSSISCIGIGSPGSQFVVLNLYSRSNGLIHLFLRHVVVSNLLGLLHLLLGLPLRRQLRGLPLRLLLLPLLPLVLLLFGQLLPAVVCCCCCCFFFCCFFCCCSCRRCCCGGSQQVPDEVVSQACNESPACIVDDRVFRKLATLN